MRIHIDQGVLVLGSVQLEPDGIFAWVSVGCRQVHNPRTVI